MVQLAASHAMLGTRPLSDAAARGTGPEIPRGSEPSPSLTNILQVVVLCCTCSSFTWSCCCGKIFTSYWPFLVVTRKKNGLQHFILFLPWDRLQHRANPVKQSHGLTRSTQTLSLKMISDLETFLLTFLVKGGSRIMNDIWLVMAVAKVGDQLSHNGSYGW